MPAACRHVADSDGMDATKRSLRGGSEKRCETERAESSLSVAGDRDTRESSHEVADATSEEAKFFSAGQGLPG